MKPNKKVNKIFEHKSIYNQNVYFQNHLIKTDFDKNVKLFIYQCWCMYFFLLLSHFQTNNNNNISTFCQSIIRTKLNGQRCDKSNNVDWSAQTSKCSFWSDNNNNSLFFFVCVEYIPLTNQLFRLFYFLFLLWLIFIWFDFISSLVEFFFLFSFELLFTGKFLESFIFIPLC